MMIQKIVQSSLNYRYLVLAAAAMIIFFGVSKFREMPIDVFPEFAPTVVEIQTEAIGL